jgi:glucans biosynthesis protein
MHSLVRLFFALVASTFAGALTAPLFAQSSPARFDHQVVQQMAREVAEKPYETPAQELPAGLKDLNYDEFRQIRFRTERTIWRGEGLEFELQVLPTGWLYKSPVEIAIVDEGEVRALHSQNDYFNLGPLAGKLQPNDQLGFSGFRINGPLNRPDHFDEIIVFQGASYFRALSRGQAYGLSARGLALNVGKPGGEEFPMFRKFWIEKPAKGARTVVVHALLDSPSVAGAYRFAITPGATTNVEVEATLYPRKELSEVGIAPLTSMFLFSPINRTRISDFRPAVHDSDGLAIWNGYDEQLWRPLNNPRRLQSSDFLDFNPRGFGLIQRARDFASFQDLEAHYERRPSAWIEPRENWGPGVVRLFEIPSEEEIHDNIVAYWKPSQGLTAGRAHSFRYGLSWPNDMPRAKPLAYVQATRAGLINGPQRDARIHRFVIDFKGYVKTDRLPTARVEASKGAAGIPVVQRNPFNDGLRASFSFDPKGAESSELRLVLSAKETPISEVWLYRWTKD